MLRTFCVDAESSGHNSLLQSPGKWYISFAYRIWQETQADFSVDVLMGWDGWLWRNALFQHPLNHLLCKRAKMKSAKTAVNLYMETDSRLISKEIMARAMPSQRLRCVCVPKGPWLPLVLITWESSKVNWVPAVLYVYIR